MTILLAKGDAQEKSMHTFTL